MNKLDHTFPIDAHALLHSTITAYSIESELSVVSEARQEKHVHFVPMAKCILQECCHLLF